MMVLGKSILLVFNLFSALLFAGEPVSHEPTLQATARSQVVTGSWRSFEARTPTAPNNFDALTVGRILHRPSICRFYWSEGNHVEDGKIFINGQIANSDRVVSVRDSEDLLKSCQRMLNENGEGFCSAVEFAGHAHMQSIGMAETIGIDLYGNKKVTLPSDPKLMNEISACLQKVTRPKAPVVFTTCGAVRRDEVLMYYPGKEAAQNELASILNRPVISALGPCRGDGFGAICEQGWYCTNNRDVSESLSLPQTKTNSLSTNP